jgi:hypothetical protein
MTSWTRRATGLHQASDKTQNAPGIVIIMSVTMTLRLGVLAVASYLQYTKISLLLLITTVFTQ